MVIDSALGYSSNDPSTTWMKVMCPPPFGSDEKGMELIGFVQYGTKVCTLSLRRSYSEVSTIVSLKCPSFPPRVGFCGEVLEADKHDGTGELDF